MRDIMGQDIKLKIEDLKIGMSVSAGQLTDIYDIYMIIEYDKFGDRIGRLVYIGDTQTTEYDKWFEQSNPITPIYNDSYELTDKSVYDE
jgi:hypothetical protein